MKQKSQKPTSFNREKNAYNFSFNLLIIKLDYIIIIKLDYKSLHNIIIYSELYYIF